ncbi:uncharacterized protein LOC134287721 [Aedes albopictus]|uniref:Secreted protein n=1 Tax=Aedes albopictus TaxID=7160 RepID=A0ABM1XPE4_AEDAL
MKDCVRFIGIAKEALKRSTLNGCWRAIWPTCVSKNETEVDMDATILKICHAVGKEGFENLEKKDLEELMIDHPIDDDELMELLIESEENFGDAEESEACGQEFNQTKLGELLEMAEKMGDMALDEDLDVERAVEFRADLRRVTLRYNQLFKQQSVTVLAAKNCSVDEERMV